MVDSTRRARRGSADASTASSADYWAGRYDAVTDREAGDDADPGSC